VFYILAYVVVVCKVSVDESMLACPSSAAVAERAANYAAAPEVKS